MSGKTGSSSRWVFGVVFEEKSTLADPAPVIPPRSETPDPARVHAPRPAAGEHEELAAAAELVPAAGAGAGEELAAAPAAGEAGAGADGEPDRGAPGSDAPAEEPGRPAEEGRIAGAAEEHGSAAGELEHAGGGRPLA